LEDTESPFLENDGYCSVCAAQAKFISYNAWLRDHYRCARCRSIPRQRALVHVLTMLRPDWRNEVIHESSPSMTFFQTQAHGYSCSYYFEDTPPGASNNGRRCENLESLTFDDHSFDIFITQDVLEHVFRPDCALAEIMRVLKEGGLHIFTVPKHSGFLKSYQRARRIDGRIEHLKDPAYHGNPISSQGSLVTWDYGVDLDVLIQKWSGYRTSCYVIRDRALGIDGEFLEVFVTRKLAVNNVHHSSCKSH